MLTQQVVSGVTVACTNTGVLFNYIDVGKLLIQSAPEDRETVTMFESTSILLHFCSMERLHSLQMFCMHGIPG